MENLIKTNLNTFFEDLNDKKPQNISIREVMKSSFESSFGFWWSLKAPKMT